VPRLAFGQISGNAKTFLHLPFPLVFALGYAAWAARLHALGMEFLGRSLFKALVQLILFRRKPRSLADVLPNADKLTQMAVAGQKAASGFLIVSIPVALLAALATFVVEAEIGWLLRPMVVSVPVVLWGWWLSFLGRRGHLPFPEPSE
jgi:hypothetical protein